MMATSVLTIGFAMAGACLLMLAWMAAAAEAGGGRRLALAGAICFGLAAWGAADIARAQDGAHGVGHAEHHDKYRSWQRPDVGGSCCNALTADDPGGDCRPTIGYVGDDGWWRVRIQPGPDGFVVVPPHKILARDPDGRCHVCERGGNIFCFAPCDPRS